MGWLRSLTVVGTVLWNFLAMGWMVLVLGNGGMLGIAMIISKNDGLVGFVLLIIALFGNALLALLLLLGHRSRKRVPGPSGVEFIPQTQ